MQIKLFGSSFLTITIPSELISNASTTNAELRKIITTELNKNNQFFQFKMINKGKMLLDDKLLKDSGLVEGGKLLITKTSDSVQQQVIKQEEQKVLTKNDRLIKLKEAVAQLSKRTDAGSDLNDHYVELTDQNGRELDIESKDKELLIQGMALSAKGSQILKRAEKIQLPKDNKSTTEAKTETTSNANNGNSNSNDMDTKPDIATKDNNNPKSSSAQPLEYYDDDDNLITDIPKYRNQLISDALELFLCADESFQLCDAKYLNLIDNYGLLALDITWCFYLLKDVRRLSEAAHYLNRAQQSFEKAHGKNRERLRNIRGGITPESILYVRLYILQAIVAYHSSQLTRAIDYLQQAQAENAQLQINDEHLTTLISMGYRLKECRRALRVCKGITAAENYIIQKQIEQEERAQAERKKREVEREQRRIGACTNGKPVEISLLRKLEEFGITYWLAAEALKQSNNNLARALDMLNEEGSRGALESLVEQNRIAWEKRHRQYQGWISREPSYSSQAQQLLSMGFSPELIRAALQMNKGNVEHALAALMSDNQLILQQWLADNPQTPENEANDDNNNIPPETDVADVPPITDLINNNNNENKSNQTIDKPKEKTAQELAHEKLKAEKLAAEQEAKRVAQEKQREIDVEIDNLADDIYDEHEDPESYLDIDLTVENQAINDYTTLIYSAISSK